MEFQVESFMGAWPEIEPLTHYHWEEVGQSEFDVYGPVDMDMEVYAKLEDVGFLHCVTARDDSVIVGYAVYFVAPSFRYKGVMIAEPDGFFLLPEHRKGFAGLNLLQECERTLVERGVQVIVGKCKVAHDCGPLFKRMGYHHGENVWSKKLRGNMQENMRGNNG